MTARVSHYEQRQAERAVAARGRTTVHERDPFARNAENYRYGILAAAVQQALSKPSGAPLSDEQVRQLSLGSDFLGNVIAGAKLVSRGEHTLSSSASGAVDALGYALGPLEAMQELNLSTEDDLLGVFREIQDCLNTSIKERQVCGSAQALMLTRALFHFLHEGILASINTRRAVSAGVPTSALW